MLLLSTVFLFLPGPAGERGQSPASTASTAEAMSRFHLVKISTQSEKVSDSRSNSLHIHAGLFYENATAHRNSLLLAERKIESVNMEIFHLSQPSPITLPSCLTYR